MCGSNCSSCKAAFKIRGPSSPRGSLQLCALLSAWLLRWTLSLVGVTAVLPQLFGKVQGPDSRVPWAACCHLPLCKLGITYCWSSTLDRRKTLRSSWQREMVSSQQETSISLFKFKCKILFLLLYCRFSRGWFFHKQASELVFFYASCFSHSSANTIKAAL